MSGIHKDGTAARAVEHLKTLESGARLSTAELAEAISYAGNALASNLRAARNAGAIDCEHDSSTGSYVWFLPEDAEPGEPEEFNAALWLDGDLILRGVQVNEDDSVTITAAQLAKLKRLIAWSPAP
jgi:hypothetical protein